MFYFVALLLVYKLGGERVYINIYGDIEDNLDFLILQPLQKLYTFFLKFKVAVDRSALLINQRNFSWFACFARCQFVFTLLSHHILLLSRMASTNGKLTIVSNYEPLEFPLLHFLEAPVKEYSQQRVNELRNMQMVTRRYPELFVQHFCAILEETTVSMRKEVTLSVIR